jgi:hypothetical protein
MVLVLCVWLLWAQEFGEAPEVVEVYEHGSPDAGGTARQLCERTAWALTIPGENLRYFCTPGGTR